MTKIEQQKAAKAFSEKWKGIGDEKQHTQTFWLELLKDVYGVENPFGFITFEDRVKLSHTSFIDASIPETHVMIEQKSLGKDLSKPIKQSDGTLLTPYQQAKRYAAELPYSKRPRWIVACNFEEFRVYDMENPQAEPEIILLKDLYKEYYRLQFLVNAADRNIKKEMEISLKAGDIVGKLYDALLKQYKDPESEEAQKSLNKLCVRLVFCLYAEDAGIFGNRNMFHDYLQGFRPENARMGLIELFEALATPLNERDPYMKAELAAFPYVNGGLFEDSRAELQRQIPMLNEEILTLLLKNASLNFDWSGISPTIFGAVFESTLNPETRRKGGMHYTSIQNIHKVIDPLFYDSLKSEFEKTKSQTNAKARRRNFFEFQQKLASLSFLDPACGSGNFLTESYISLRKLENAVLSEMYGGNMALDFGGEFDPIKVKINQFYGIEINDFAVTVSKTALWIAESQAMQDTENIIHKELDFLPLKSYTNIIEGNALRMNWEDVLPKSKCSFIMGNPPFVGYSFQNPSQKEDIKFATGLSAKNLDYVAAWYFKAAAFIYKTDIVTAFVSTNSITQGEQVAVIWKPLIEKYSVNINFAYQTFRWDSESNEKAHVHCVIVGFGAKPSTEKRRLYSGNKMQFVENINPYLLASETIFIEKKNEPICSGALPMMRGSQPTDDGNLVLTEEEKREFLKIEPKAEKFIRPFMMGKDFIDRKPRYCLWLVGVSPAEIRKCPHILKRVEAVKNFRLKSKKAATRKKAETPMLFDEIKECKTNYIAIPVVSSESRRYIPMDYLKADVIAGNKLFMIPNGSLYHFGVLTSNVHMAWMRTVAGRLKSDYSYSNTIVYNNFPWPNATDKQKAAIEKTAAQILDARKLYPDSSLADLYDETLMPKELREAHQANDRAVMAAYGFDAKMTEAGCVAELFKLYREMVKKEV
ncbi:MAG: class I SAM-dependent DNA methyltransferase [Selenomonadaceae bacterium]|nr:class I SAM-dependent DNA methyltransferase [Selenomonadaceae bacterium]